MRRGGAIVFGILIFLIGIDLASAQFYSPIQPPTPEVQCCFAIQYGDPAYMEQSCEGLDLDEESCIPVLEAWTAEQSNVLQENSPLYAAIVLFILGALLF